MARISLLFSLAFAIALASSVLSVSAHPKKQIDTSCPSTVSELQTFPFLEISKLIQKTAKTAPKTPQFNAMFGVCKGYTSYLAAFHAYASKDVSVLLKAKYALLNKAMLTAQASVSVKGKLAKKLKKCYGGMAKGFVQLPELVAEISARHQFNVNAKISKSELGQLEHCMYKLKKSIRGFMNVVAKVSAEFEVEKKGSLHAGVGGIIGGFFDKTHGFAGKLIGHAGAHAEKKVGVHAGAKVGAHAEKKVGVHAGAKVGVHAEKKVGVHAGAKVGAHAEKKFGVHAGAKVGAHAEKKVGVQAGAKVGVHAEKKVGVQAGAKVGVHAEKKFGFHAGAKAGVHAEKKVGFHAGAKAGAHAEGKVGAHVGAKVGVHAGAKVGAHVGAKIGGHIGAKVAAHAGAKVGAKVGAHAGAKVGAHAGAKVGGKVGAHAGAQGNLVANAGAQAGGKLGGLFGKFFQSRLGLGGKVEFDAAGKAKVGGGSGSGL